jgi:hypothetical protein
MGKRGKRKHCEQCGMFIALDGVCSHCSFSSYIDSKGLSKAQHEHCEQTGVFIASSGVSSGSSQSDAISASENVDFGALSQNVVNDVGNGVGNVRRCENCFRCDHDCFGNLTSKVNVQLCPTIGMNFRKKLSSFPISCTAVELMLCDECYWTLVCLEEGQSSGMYKWEDCWPSFLWQMFTDSSNQQYAIEMWKYIPLTFLGVILRMLQIMGMTLIDWQQVGIWVI